MSTANGGVIWARVYRRKEIVLALADKELMGEEFREGDFILAVNSFFQGELVNEEEVEALLKQATVVNAVGERAVAAVIKAGLSKERFVKTVAGVPHVQAVLHLF
jgi:hypothetical protein